MHAAVNILITAAKVEEGPFVTNNITWLANVEDRDCDGYLEKHLKNPKILIE